MGGQRKGGYAAVAALLVACSLPVATARADVAADPETLIQQANELRRKGDNARAYGYLKRAYELAPTPRSAAQLGLVEHALGRYADAEVHLGEALATADPWVQTNRPRLESSRSFVRGKLGKVEITGAPADASVAVGTDPSIKLAADRVVYLAPGEHTLRIEAPGRLPVTRTVTVAVGQAAAIAVDLPVEQSAAGPGDQAGMPYALPPVAGSGGGGDAGAGQQSPPPAAPSAPMTGIADRSSSRALRITGLGVAGGGVAIGVAGFFVRGVATSKMEAINSDAMAGRPYDEGNGNWKTFEQAGVAMMVTGGAAVVAGTVLYLLNMAPSSSEASVAFAPGAGGGTVSVLGRF